MSQVRGRPLRAQSFTEESRFALGLRGTPCISVVVLLRDPVILSFKQMILQPQKSVKLSNLTDLSLYSPLLSRLCSLYIDRERMPKKCGTGWPGERALRKEGLLPPDRTPKNSHGILSYQIS
jgi:hypothetical protein